MAKLVALGAALKCSFGTAPTALIVTITGVTADKVLAANINDKIPITNVPTFAMCSSLANPTTASATTAASGVLTPTPCVPALTAPWAPGSTSVTLRKMPALNDSSKLMCTYAGVIEVTNAGTMTVTVA